MNKLKGKLCAFCMIFSAIVTYSDAASYDYKCTLKEKAQDIAEDLRKKTEDIYYGVGSYLGGDAEETEANINSRLTKLLYSQEECTKMKINAYGTDNKADIHSKLNNQNEPLLESILEASLKGDIEIPYWENKDGTAKPFLDVLESDIDSKLICKNIALSELVKFAHDLRNVGWSPSEFLSLYSKECKDGVDMSTERCSKCRVWADIKEEINNKLSPYEDAFMTFVNVIRSIGNEHTYKRMRQNLLYGDAKAKTPNAADIETAGNADLFNFLHLFLKAVVDPQYGQDDEDENINPGKETNIAQVVHNWLTKNCDYGYFYPKVVSTLLDMMYIAHVGKGKTATDATISNIRRHILSQEALKMLNQALEDIMVDKATYRLIGVNDLRIEDDSKDVLGLTNAISNDATSFLLPVAFLQKVDGSEFLTYNGAPLLMASDIVYMVKNKALPIVSMFMCENTPVSTYRTGYNLMKQSIAINNVTHDGSYFGGLVALTQYGGNKNPSNKSDWDLKNDVSITLENKKANLIVAELFSWYTKILDVSGITGETRSKYATEFANKTNDVPSAHAFIVTGAKKVEKISTSVSVAYTPNTVYKGNDKYTDEHYIMWSLSDLLDNVQVRASTQEITGSFLITSLLNSSWGKTMLRTKDEDYSIFKNLSRNDGTDGGKAQIPLTDAITGTLIDESVSTFNQNSRRTNHSSTVHDLELFQEGLQLISNYTFPGFQPHKIKETEESIVPGFSSFHYTVSYYAYGFPLATLQAKEVDLGDDKTDKERTCTFITELLGGTNQGDIQLQDSTPLLQKVKFGTSS